VAARQPHLGDLAVHVPLPEVGAGARGVRRCDVRDHQKHVAVENLGHEPAAEGLIVPVDGREPGDLFVGDAAERLGTAEGLPHHLVELALQLVEVPFPAWPVALGRRDRLVVAHLALVVRERVQDDHRDLLTRRPQLHGHLVHR